MAQYALRVVIFWDTFTWVAWCLEHDIMSQGSTPEEALDSFHHVLGTEVTLSSVASVSHLEGIKPAPQAAQDRWDAIVPGQTEIFWISGVTFMLTVRIDRR